MVSGSSTVMIVLLVVHMYAAAAAVPSSVPVRMKTIIDTS